jgi:hypothetical protein
VPTWSGCTSPRLQRQVKRAVKAHRRILCRTTVVNHDMRPSLREERRTLTRADAELLRLYCFQFDRHEKTSRCYATRTSFANTRDQIRRARRTSK